MDIATYYANKYARYSHVIYHDLISIGQETVWRCCLQWQTSTCKFRTYCHYTVRFRVTDWLRTQMVISRRAHERRQRYFAEERRVMLEEKRTPSDEELWQRVRSQKYKAQRDQHVAMTFRQVSLDLIAEEVEGLEDPSVEHPDSGLVRTETQALLEKALLVLTDKERHLINLYYFEELTLREVGKLYNVSESRISQQLTKALAQLGRELKTHGLSGNWLARHDLRPSVYPRNTAHHTDASASLGNSLQ